jgi:hypothetical protein
VRPDEIVVFLGPSLGVDRARRVLPARYLAPVRCGDVLRANRLTPRAIAIIDGLFETTAAVWHKEILLAIECGIAVFGAASMGALRAAELEPFGMVGVGRIFECYRDGSYEDDDEVALLHGGAFENYPALTEPMVNVRATAARAARHGVIARATAARLVSCAKEMFYQERTLDLVIERAWGASRRQRDEAARFRRFLERGGHVDQKRLDALALLRHLAALARRRSAAPPRVRESKRQYRVLFRLQHEVTSRPFASADPDLPVTEHVALEARFLGTTYRLLRRLAQLMAIVHAFNRAGRTSPAGHRRPPSHPLALPPTSRRHSHHRAATPDDLAMPESPGNARGGWAQDLDARARRCVVARAADVRAFVESAESARGARPARRQLDADILALMRLEGRYPQWRHAGCGNGPGAEDAVLASAERYAAVEFQAMRRVARVWQALDDGLVRLGVAGLATAQELSDAFRRARGLGDRATMLAWLRDNDLDVEGYTRLVSADARLVMLCDGTCAHSLGLTDGAEAVCWLLDAIRLAGLYPDLRRRCRRASAASGQGPARGAADRQDVLRAHFAHLREPVPADLDAYARAHDFPGGEAEFEAGLARRVRVIDQAVE